MNNLNTNGIKDRIVFLQNLVQKKQKEIKKAPKGLLNVARKGERRKWIDPIELSDDEFVVQWLQQEYPRKGFAADAPEYYTDNGERVRSKSEIMIANALKKHNIPYRYEAPLYLNELGTIHPDFTVLNVKERKEYYWEHMGKNG